MGHRSAWVGCRTCDADALHHGPGLPSSQQGGWEDDSVEGDIVLAHELDEVHVLWILPPCLPENVGRMRLMSGRLQGRGVCHELD